MNITGEQITSLASVIAGLDVLFALVTPIWWLPIPIMVLASIAYGFGIQISDLANQILNRERYDYTECRSGHKPREVCKSVHVHSGAGYYH